MLGCTEIPLILKQEDAELPLFDTLKIYAEAGVDFLLGDRATVEGDAAGNVHRDAG